MKKKLITICLLTALLASMLVGCGEKQPAAAEPAPAQQPAASTVSEPAKTTPTDTSAADPEPSTEPEPEAVRVYQETTHAYETVINQVCDVLYNGYSTEDDYSYVASGIMESSTMERTRLLQYLGFTYEDISGDGIPELLIGTIPDKNAEIPETQFIFSGYTCKDGEPVCFLEGWARNVYEWMGDGRFFYYGSGGWAYSGFGTFHISEDGTKLICEDWYFSDTKDEGSDEVGFFHNTSGIWDKNDGEEMDVDFDGFWALSNKYDAELKTLDLMPFADYPYEGYIAQPLDCKVRVDYFDDVSYQSYYDDASEYMDQTAEYETRILFRSDEGVADFKLLSLSLKDVDASGNATFDITEVFNIPALRAGIPLAAPMSFPGDIPSNGFSYTDSDGTTKTYAIGVSGRDGSLFVTPID
ncbi:MAG: hypothetical protein E7425_11270 [Ruminococcaceae bacterium]|nr:hypothetical protein [Oscillospiraceae bacterium]